MTINNDCLLEKDRLFFITKYEDKKKITLLKKENPMDSKKLSVVLTLAVAMLLVVGCGQVIKPGNERVYSDASSVVGQITGEVTATGTEQPIVGAVVSVNGTNTGAVADQDGEYIIYNVSPGICSLVVTAIGFEMMVVENVDVAEKLNSYHDVAMKPIGTASDVGWINGKVTDETGQIIIGACIGLMGTDLGAVADQDGEYIIYNVSPGTYTIEIDAICYKTVTHNVTVKYNSGSEQNVILPLK